MKQLKEKRAQLDVKSLLSKLYFSRSQENYAKLYGNEGKYRDELVRLMPKMSRKKLNKIVEEVKENNFVFQRYLEKERIVRLTVEDVNSFENKMQAQGKILTSRLSPRGDTHKQLDIDITRIGFMMILEKINHQLSDNFISESKYLKQLIQRESENLSNFGYEYVGTKSHKKKPSVVNELGFEELRNGKFKLIGNKIREQTEIIQDVESFLDGLTYKSKEGLKE